MRRWIEMGKRPAGKIAMIVMSVIFSVVCAMEVASPFINYWMINRMKFPDDPETEAYVNTIFDRIQNKDWEEIRKSFATVPEENDKGLAQAREFFQNKEIIERKLVDYKARSSSTIVTTDKEKHDLKTVELLYAVSFSGEPGLLLVIISATDKIISLHTLNMSLLPKPYMELLKENAGIFSGKYIAVSVLMILFTLFLIFTEYDYYKIAKPPKTWLQILLSTSVFFEYAASSKGFQIGKGIEIISFPLRLNGVKSLSWQGYRISIPLLLIFYWVYYRRRTKKKQKEATVDEKVEGKS